MAEGSLNGLLKGKFYNPCTRIHQLLATELEKALFIKYLEHNKGDKLLASSIMDQGDPSQEHTEPLVEDVRVINVMDRYETYLHGVMKGEYDNTAAYWATYVYFINRVYCELLCTVRTNDIEGYINVSPSVIEGVRDIFARLLTLAARESKAIDLHHILCYLITDVPLSLAHADGIPLKTEKASLTKLLESKQTSVLTNINLPSISCSIIDGGLILYEVLVQQSTSSYVVITTELLARVCSLQGMEIHLLLDKYKSPSIDNERKLRCRTEEAFIITGPQQIQKQPCVKLVKKCSFKEEFSKFVLIEWKKTKYGSIIKDKKNLSFSWWKMCAIST